MKRWLPASSSLRALSALTVEGASARVSAGGPEGKRTQEDEDSYRGSFHDCPI